MFIGTWITSDLAMKTKKKTLSSCPRRPRCGNSAHDEVSRKALRDSIKTLCDKHFAPWKISPPEEALFDLAERLEKIGGALRTIAASGKLPPKAKEGATSPGAGAAR